MIPNDKFGMVGIILSFHIKVLMWYKNTHFKRTIRKTGQVDSENIMLL